MTTKDQRKCLKALQDNPEITIQKADKRSALVVMNTKDYLREGYRQVLDTNFCTKIDHDPTKEVSDKISSKLNQMKECGLITDKNYEYLNLKICKYEQFYLLPKIHKKIFQVDQYAVQ